MKLYFAKGTCALAPHIILKELDLPHEAIRVDLTNKTLPDGSDYRQVNALGYVPALELDDGDVLVEGVAILMYLADLSPMFRVEGHQRYHLLSRLTFISSEVHKRYSALFNRKLSDDAKLVFRDQLHARLGDFERMLGNQDYLMPTGFSVADAYAYTVISWSRNQALQMTPKLQAYLDRVHARPTVQAARAAESPKAA